MPTSKELREAADILEKIEKLQARYQAIVGGTGGGASLGVDSPRRKERNMSEEGRAAISAAAKARWAKIKAGNATPPRVKGVKGKKKAA